MKKVKYFKKIKNDKNFWYSESWGYPLDVELPNKKTLHLACEFYRGTGWILIDRDTGLLAQHDVILNRKQLTEYISVVTSFYSRITDTEYYKAQKDELNQFLKNIEED